MSKFEYLSCEFSDKEYCNTYPDGSTYEDVLNDFSEYVNILNIQAREGWELAHIQLYIADQSNKHGVFLLKRVVKQGSWSRGAGG